jgi:hypothetical protein
MISWTRMSLSGCGGQTPPTQHPLPQIDPQEIVRQNPQQGLGTPSPTRRDYKPHRLNLGQRQTNSYTLHLSLM